MASDIGLTICTAAERKVLEACAIAKRLGSALDLLRTALRISDVRLNQDWDEACLALLYSDDCKGRAR